MPLTLDKPDPAAMLGINPSPKFFDPHLTGTGKKMGILNESVNPVHLAAGKIFTSQENVAKSRRQFTSGNTSTNIIPINPISAEMWTELKTVPMPDQFAIVKIGEYDYKGAGAQSTIYDIYLGMDVHSIVLDSTISGTITAKTTRVCYMPFLAITKDPKKDLAVFVTTPDDKGYTAMRNGKTTTTAGSYSVVGNGVSNRNPLERLYSSVAPYAEPLSNTIISLDQNKNTLLASTDGLFVLTFTCDPFDWARCVKEYFDSVNAISYDVRAIEDFLTDYSAYDGACVQSERWQTNIADVMHLILDQFADEIKKDASMSPGSSHVISRIAKEISRLDNYKINLDLYRTIYQDIVAYCNNDQTKYLTKQNLNLMLSDHLNDLNNKKSKLSKIPKPPTGMTLQLPFTPNPSQKDAIETTSPLALVQSGAGSGKSSVILARLNYLQTVGVKPSDITVLSFTNAAADHIHDLAPQIHSMTIASMVHTIYAENFPQHTLSSLDTLKNTLDIYYPPDMLNCPDPLYETARLLHRHCAAIVKETTNLTFTNMNNFIEDNFDAVLQILDVLRQTSLELEIIICYQALEKLKEPAETKTKHLIIDEVQDNSIFEFVWALKYCTKNESTLFIVGDCSQTLYEFRASNPAALNVLEGSGIFDTFKLDINYRSNQEILDYANAGLREIEANRYANIQLRANSLRTPTEDSFKYAVQVSTHHVGRLKDFDTAIPHILEVDVYPWVLEKLALGEKVTFLAYSRRHVGIMQETLEKLFGPKSKRPANIANLCSDRMHNATIFSKFIARHWAKAAFIPTKNFCSIVADAMYAVADSLTYGSKEECQRAVSYATTKWRNECEPVVEAWRIRVENGAMPLDAFYSSVKQLMLDHEIKTNAVRQSLISQRNLQKKEEQANLNAELMVSTIHGVKGLEFDNVVVLVRDTVTTPEDMKRLYYVALSRAKHCEMVIAYGTEHEDVMENRYNQIVTELQERDAKMKLRGTFQQFVPPTPPAQPPVPPTPQAPGTPPAPMTPPIPGTPPVPTAPPAPGTSMPPTPPVPPVPPTGGMNPAIPTNLSSMKPKFVG